MPTVLAIANQKGGVGKTTTATNLASGLAKAGRRVLLVDIDPQGNATSGVGLDLVDRSPAFRAGPDGDAAVPTAWPGVACIPAGRDLERLAGHGGDLAARFGANLRRAAEGPGERQAEAVLVDCPPSLGPLTQAALARADGVVIPIQCEYYPLEGLVQLLAAVRAARTRNPRLTVAGILLTMYDPGAPLSREVEAEVRGKLAEPVFEAVVPRDAAVAEAPSHCRSVIDYAPRSRGARAYVELTAELIARGLAKPALATEPTEGCHD